MKLKKTAWIAWTLCGIIAASTLISLATSLGGWQASNNVFELAGSLMFSLLPVVFAFLAALILSYQPHNVIGWLLMMPALLGILPVEAYLRSFAGPPAQPPIQLLLALWYSNWSWLMLIFPILFIPVLFPAGQPPSTHWRWLLVGGLAMCALFIFMVTFSTVFQSIDSNWSVPNPIGFLPLDFWDKYLSVVWPVGLFSMTLLSVASLFVRYRRAALVEREQIKWLLFACTLFAVVYIPGWWISDLTNIINDLWTILLCLAILAIPAAITVAVLRYRLYDIDIIIRRTLIYTALTITLILVYFGSVVLMQSLVAAVGGPRTAVVTVISTLLIAALFAPLRRRIQNDIDRRFYRKKYNADVIVAAFGASLREKVDLDDLQIQVVSVVEETLQPEHLSLWLRPVRPLGSEPASNRFPR